MRVAIFTAAMFLGTCAVPAHAQSTPSNPLTAEIKSNPAPPFVLAGQFPAANALSVVPFPNAQYAILFLPYQAPLVLDTHDLGKISASRIARVDESQIRNSGSIDFEPDGSRLYIANDECEQDRAMCFGVEIFDASDPKNIREIGTWGEQSATALALSSEDKILFVGDRKRLSLVALDVSNPTSPREISRLGLKGAVENIRLSRRQRRLFFTLVPGGMKIVDYSKAGALKVVGSFPMELPKGLAITFDEMTAFTSSCGSPHGQSEAGLVTLDIANPKKVERVSPGYSARFRCSDLYLRSGDQELFVENDTEIDMLNVRDPKRIDATALIELPAKSRPSAFFVSPDAQTVFATASSPNGSARDFEGVLVYKRAH